MKINRRKYLLLAKIALILLPLGLFLKACTTASSKESAHKELFADSLLTEAQKRLPENAVRGLKVLPGLDVKQITIFLISFGDCDFILYKQVNHI